MSNLRINQKEYINTGVKDKSLKGRREFHVTFKFDDKDEAKKFTQDVKDCHSSCKDVCTKIKTELDDTTNKKPVRSKPGPQKGKGGRPAKKNT